MKITKDMINPELRKVGALARLLFHIRSERTFRFIQKLVKLLNSRKKPAGLDFEEKIIKTANNPKLRLCIYKGKEEKPSDIGFLWIHGGGYGFGIPELDLTFINNFIKAKNCVIVSPDYRLSIEAPFPAAIDDCYDSLVWMKENAKELGISRIFVGGESAGGGLTAAVCLMARDKGEVNISYQMPFYPMLDDRLTKSSTDNDAPMWNTKSNQEAWKIYLKEVYGTDVSKYAAPARETDYTNLPPAYTFVGSIDPFLDETKAYIENLKNAGIEAELDIYPGCYHSFDYLCQKTSIAKKAIAKYIEKFKEAAERYRVDI